MSVRLPGLLSPNLTERSRLRPTAGSLTIKMVGSSEAVLTLPEDEADIQIHDWVSVYTEEGPAGLFRVTNVAQPLKKQVDVTLLHGIDILSDSVWAEQTEFSGTKEAFLRAMLNQQTQLINGQRPWVLGVCEDTATVRRDINYDRLSTLLEGLNEDGGNYWFTYDMTVFPWVLNYVHVDNTVVSEFRLTRNIRSATVTYNDADLCTRLFLTVSTKTEETVPTKRANPAYISDQATPNVPRVITENITVSSVDSRIKQYNNVSAQGDWGIVVKTADIDTTDDILNGHFESADAWAAAFLARRSAPSVQIQIDGDDLFALTGDVWDRTKVGRLCQVALPAYGKAFQERVVSVTYPDLYRQDEIPRTTHVTVSLSNTLPRFSESLAQAEKEAASASRSSRSTARAQTREEKELTTWSQHVQWQGAALDGSGIMTLYESGIDMDATGGVKIYSLENGLQGLYAAIQVNARAIDAKVGSDALQGLLHIDEFSTTLGNLAKGADGGTIGAYIATAINKQTGQGIVQITGDKVNITGLVTMTDLEAVEAKIDNVRGDTIIANTYLSAATGKFNNLWVESPGANGATNTAKVNNAVNGIRKDTSLTDGLIGFEYTTLANPTWQKVNFNIADTAYFQQRVGIDAANLTLTEIGQTPYNASTADEITGITAGTSDKYFLIAASPKTGDAVYKKFVLPAASAPPVVASIDDITGTTLAANQIADTNITITASGTNVSAYSESVALEESTYQVGSITRPCVVLKVDGNVVGRIYTQNAYQAGQSAGVASASITNLSGVTLATNQIMDSAIPITASGTNVSNYTENVSMEESTYQVGSATRPCVVLKVDGNVVGRIYTQNAYQAGQSAGAASAAGSITNLSGTAIATNQIKDTAIQITASGTNVSSYSENVSMEESTYQVGSVTRPCVVLKVDGAVVGRIYTQNAYQAGANSVTPASASIDDISGTAIDATVLKASVPVTASGTNVSSRTENAVLARATYQVGSATNHCVTLSMDSTVIGRISTQSVFIDGRDSVTITNVERIASCAFDPDARTARQDVRFTLSNGSTYTLHENFDAIYRAGMNGTSVDTTIEYAADLSSEGVVFDADVDEDAQGNPLRINLSDIYQRGVTDATPAEKHWYTYCTSGYVTIYVRGSGSSGGSGIGGAIYDLLNKMVASTQIAFYPFTPVEVVGSELGYTKVSYGGNTYFVDPSNLTESEEDLSIGHRIGIKNLQEVITVTSRTMTGLIHTGGCTSNISVYLEPRYGNTGNFTSSYMSSSDFSSYRANGSVSDYFYEMATMADYYGRHEKTAFGSDIQHKAVFHIIYSNNDEEDVIVSFKSYARAQDEVVYTYTGYIDASNYVNLRSTASTGGSILVQVPDGAAVRCKYSPNGYTDTWMPVQYGGKTGYIQSQYIEGTNAWKELNTKKAKTITLVGVAHAIGSSRKDFTVMINTMTAGLKAVTSYAKESSEYAYDWAVTNNDPENYLNHVAGSDYLYHRKSDCSSRILMRVKLNVTYTNPSKFPAETIVLSVYSAAK